MEKDIIAVVHDNIIEMVDLRGQPKMSKKIGLSRFEFDFNVEGMGEKTNVQFSIKIYFN
jgi:hypothetical protein